MTTLLSMHKSLQGSALLLTGRVLSISLNLITQLLTIRYLSKLDFGMLAFALIVVNASGLFLALGLDKALSRYLPIYIVRQQARQFCGALLASIVLVVTLGLLAGGAAAALLAGDLGFDGQARLVALALLFMAPLAALDRILEATLAALGRSREIAVRKYLLRPLLRLGLVAAAIAASGSAALVATAHTTTVLLGCLIYGAVVWRQLHQRGLLVRPALSNTMRRDLAGYARLQLGSDMTLTSRTIGIPAIISLSGGAVAMAAYAAILPIARLNELVMEACAPLFTPTSAQLRETGAADEQRSYYWRTIAWIALGSFPVFAMTTVFPGVVIQTLLGERYLSSQYLLMLVACGMYAHACFGFNARWLRLENAGHLALRADLAVTMFEAALALLLVWQMGALGAAVAIALAMTAHGWAKQRLLLSIVDLQARRYAAAALFVRVFAAWLLLHVLNQLAAPGLFGALVLTTLVWLGLLRLTRRWLRISELFPFTLRWPIGRWLFAP